MQEVRLDQRQLGRLSDKLWRFYLGGVQNWLILAMYVMGITLTVQNAGRPFYRDIYHAALLFLIVSAFITLADRARRQRRMEADLLGLVGYKAEVEGGKKRFKHWFLPPRIYLVTKIEGKKRRLQIHPNYAGFLRRKGRYEVVYTPRTKLIVDERLLEAPSLEELFQFTAEDLQAHQAGQQIPKRQRRSYQDQLNILGAFNLFVFSLPSAFFTISAVVNINVEGLNLYNALVLGLFIPFTVMFGLMLFFIFLASFPPDAASAYQMRTAEVKSAVLFKHEFMRESDFSLSWRSPYAHLMLDEEQHKYLDDKSCYRFYYRQLPPHEVADILSVEKVL